MSIFQSVSMIATGSINVQIKTSTLNYIKLIFDPNAFSHLVIPSLVLFESLFCGMNTHNFHKKPHTEFPLFNKLLLSLVETKVRMSAGIGAELEAK